MSLTRVLPALAAALTLAGLGVGGVAVAAEPSGGPTPAIIDGSNAQSGPWAARLFSGGQEACSSTIISSRWILTAQHCVAGGDLSFNIGDLDQTKGEHATAVSVTEHPSVDLALVELDHDVSATYAPLADQQLVNAGDDVQVYGWGATCTDRPEIQCQAPLLKVATVQVSGVNAPCTDYRGGDAVCATRGDGITAGGDSGGPMFSGDTQIGVASTSDRSTSTAYTHIAPYRDWIRQVAGV